MAADAHCVPQQGTLFAGRYRLVEPCGPSGTVDGAPEHWRGLDEVLNRPVRITVLLADTPEGAELLSSAVANGRVAHPGVASVFDAANVDGCTYVVAEWVEGTSLADLLREQGPLPTAQAAALIQEAAETVSVLHEQGLVHGNLVPSSVLLTAEGVKLTSLRSNAATAAADDVRRLGALLYAALTERWPVDVTQAEVPGIPAAPYEGGRLCEPRQVRAGVSGTLSLLAMRALNPVETGTSAEHLASGLIGHTHEDEVVAFDEPEPRRSWRRGVLLLAGLLVISLAGLLVGIALSQVRGPDGGFPALGIGAKPSQSPAAAQPPAIEPVAAVILDPEGDGTELNGAQRAIDGQPSTAWRTDNYKRPRFGNLKHGMGVVVDLGSDRQVRTVSVDLATPGATLKLYAAGVSGTSLAAFPKVAASQSVTGSTVTFTLAKPTRARYWVIWFTELPAANGGYESGVAEVRFS